jgi:RNA polymerase sigma-70 factor (ECF subfamily)
LSDTIAATGGDPHLAAEVSEQAAELRLQVDALPADQREALLLHYVEGLSAKQVALSMHRSLAATNSLLQRARQTLRSKEEIR